MKKVVVTGAAGFAGWHLTRALVRHGNDVMAIVRPHSKHNDRLNEIRVESKKRGWKGTVTEIPYEITSDGILISVRDIAENCDLFFHLAWIGGRDDLTVQRQNIDISLRMVTVADALHCRRWICTGSQAEYGILAPMVQQTEDMCPHPADAYGTAKVAASYMTKRRCEQLGIEWIWGRIFSLIGKYEPDGRMLPDLIHTLQSGGNMKLTSATQNWDYLDAADCAEALVALAERGKPGEIYNIANGNYRPLRSFTDEVWDMFRDKGGHIEYGADTRTPVSLQPSVEKIFRDTGWKPKIPFNESIASYS